jgi:phage-related protein
MPAGRVIGRVSVKVLPDTDDFRKKAQRDLDRIEKQLSVTVAARLNTDSLKADALRAVREINAENRSSDHRKIRFYATISTQGMREEMTKAMRRIQAQADMRRVKLHVNFVGAEAKLELDEHSLDEVQRQIDHWRRGHDPIKLQVEPGLGEVSLRLTQGRLALLARDRIVKLRPVLDSGAVAKVATGLAALSGARVIGDWLEDIFSTLKRFDKLVAPISAVSLGIAGLGGYALTAASNLFALSASLAQIGPAGLALPGIFGGIAIGLGITVAAMKDFNTQVPQVKAALSKLQDGISANFWAGFKQPMSDLVDTLLPGFISGMNAAATQLGKFWGGLAGDLTGALNPLLSGMFADLASSISIFSGATGALANIIAVLGSVGAGYLPQMAQWFADITTQFSDFLTRANSDGSLQGWIDAGVQGLSDLGRVLFNLGGILAGIARAASAAGGSSLGMMADTLERVHAAIDTPAFQTGLTGVLTAAHQAMTNIASTSGPAVEKLFAALTGTLTTILPIAGQAIGSLLHSVASALAQPELQNGLVSMFQGIAVAVAALAPAFGPVGKALGALATLIGQFAPIIGQLAASAFVPLADALTAIIPALTPLITLLGGALIGVVQQLAPVLGQLVQAFVQLMSGGVLPAVSAVIAALVPIIGQLLAVIAPIVTQLVTGLAPILVLVAQFVAVLITAIAPLLVMLVQLVGAILLPLIPMLQSVAAAILPALGEAFTAVAAALAPLIQALIAVVGFIMPILVPILGFLIEILARSLVDAIRGVAQILTGLKDVFVGVFNFIKDLFTGQWGKLWEDAKQIASGVWNLIKGAFNVFMNLGILKVGKLAFDALKAGWTVLWDGIKLVAVAIWTNIKVGWTLFLAALKESPSAAIRFIKELFTDLWTTLKTKASEGWEALKSAFRTGVIAAEVLIKGLPGKCVAALGDLGSTLKDAGKKLLQGFIDGISQMFDKVKGKLGELTGKLTDWKGPESLDRVLLVDAGVLIIDGFIDGLESRYDAVKKSLQGLTADVEGTTIKPPSIGQIRAAAGISAAVDGALTASLAGGGGQKVLNYYAAPGSSIDNEEDLFAAANRARMGW